jgi:hypothetical protein
MFAKAWSFAFEIGKHVFVVFSKRVQLKAVCNVHRLVTAFRIMKSITLVFALVLSLFAVSCAPSTPAARIAKRPQAFEKLSTEHQELVMNGSITKGMNRAAVALALGEPDGIVEVFRDSRSLERWEYMGSQPVVNHNFYGGFGFGRRRGMYCDGFGGGFGGGFGPDITYIPYVRSYVMFYDGKVDEWERVR